MQPRPIRYLLVTDGSSDACLTHPIAWTLRTHGWDEHQGEWADLRQSPPPDSTLAERLRAVRTRYAADLVFIHRDAEKQSREDRLHEIATAIATIGQPMTHVGVVPVRMTEAWLLHDAAAIRRAAGKPNGKAPLPIPSSIKQFETLADPKQTLNEALLAASEASGRLRKRKQRDFGRMRLRVAELIDDFAPLRALEAFAAFEHDLLATLATLSR